MNEELKQFQPTVMLALGFLMQYARGYRGFPEWGYHLIAVGLALFGFVLFNPIIYNDWRYTVVMGLVGIVGNLGSIWGGSFVTSHAAKAHVNAGGDPQNILVPLTNSK